VLKNNEELFDIVSSFLGKNLPFLDVQQLLNSGKTVGIVGLVGLTFTGIGWIEAIRSSQRLIWRLNQQPGYFGVRQAVDLLVLIGILLLLTTSQLAVYGLEKLLDYLAGGRMGFLLSAASLVLTIAINMLFAAALLAAVPRLRMTARRLLPPVLQVGIGITLLNTVGKTFVGLIQRNPAYGLVASAVGVLVYLYVFNQLLLLGASWAATSSHGRVVDLSADDKTAPVGQNTWIRYDRPR
jgi:membrane protein